MGTTVLPNPDPTAGIIAQAQQSANASIHNSDNMTQLGMAQIGAQIIQAQQMFTLGQMQIQSQLSQAQDQLDAKLYIAKLNYRESMSAEENRHQEKLGEMDLRRLEIDQAARQGNSISTDAMLV